MEVDMRKHQAIRDAVHAGISALRVQGRQIWGDTRCLTTSEVVVRLMVGVGDLARIARDWSVFYLLFDESDKAAREMQDSAVRELKKELGNIVFSTIRWIDDLGFDVLECLDLAIEAQEKFAKSGRPR
jgi:hypothetical protein